MTPALLIVDDDESFCLAVKLYFEKLGFSVSSATSLRAGRKSMQSQRVSVLLLDLDLPDGSGLEWIGALREEHPKLALVVVTGSGDVPTAVEAMRRGADHFVTKPVSFQDLSVFLEKAMEMGHLRQKEAVHRRLASAPEFVTGNSQAASQVMKLAGTAAAGESPILLLGETGTGKGVLARWIHHRSPRKGEPFVEINCSGLRGELLATELFGHAKGAFTSATEHHQGLLDVAQGGTLFLDEIGDMELVVQAQFLKTVEDKPYRRLGETTTRFSDFRLICATNKDLEVEVQEGRFRRDLFFRINVFPIALPPLRERREDIEIMAGGVLKSLGVTGSSLSASVLAALSAYEWPGNIRELRNVLERAVLLSGGQPLAPEHLSGLSPRQKRRGSVFIKSRSTAPSAAAIKEALNFAGGDKTQAALSLGVSRATLYRLLKKHVAFQS